MTPGPKRRGKKDLTSQRGSVRQGNTSTPDILNGVRGEVKQNEANVQNDKLSEAECPDGSYIKNSYQKYSKRHVQSNWDRYEERTPGLFEDVLRGGSFEVLACYQGGSDSYMKLKEEKEWCNTKDSDDGLFLDCDALAQSLKCIPLHKRLHVPEDCFPPEMIQKFMDIAERSSSWKFNSPLSLSCVKDDLPTLGTFTNSQDASSEVAYKSKVISEKTENIILSLTSCAALKDEIPKMLPKIEQTPPSVTSDDSLRNALPKPETSHDDLAFLLSLSGSDKHSSDAIEEKGSSASIEDWLNELLEK